MRVSDASANIAPVAVAFHARDEPNKELLEERNITVGRAFAKAGIGPMLIAEAEDFKWCINKWGGGALSEKSTGPGCKNEATCVAAIEQMAIWSHDGEFREGVERLLGKIHRMSTD